MQLSKWLLGLLLLSVSGSVAAAGVTILTPDNVNDLVNPEFSVVAEAFIDESFEDQMGVIELSICHVGGDPGDIYCEHDSYIRISCGEVSTPVGTDPLIILHNEKRVKGWVCSTDLCKLVVSAEVDLTSWGLVSGDRLMASITVFVGVVVIGTDEKTFTVK